jgi:hypothetical protein
MRMDGVKPADADSVSTGGFETKLYRLSVRIYGIIDMTPIHTS